MSKESRNELEIKILAEVIFKSDKGIECALLGDDGLLHGYQNDAMHYVNPFKFPIGYQKQYSIEEVNEIVDGAIEVTYNE